MNRKLQKLERTRNVEHYTQIATLCTTGPDVTKSQKKFKIQTKLQSRDKRNRLSRFAQKTESDFQKCDPMEIRNRIKESLKKIRILNFGRIATFESDFQFSRNRSTSD